jgi:hypothetical protein
MNNPGNPIKKSSFEQVQQKLGTALSSAHQRLKDGETLPPSEVLWFINAVELYHNLVASQNTYIDGLVDELYKQSLDLMLKDQEIYELKAND